MVKGVVRGRNCEASCTVLSGPIWVRRNHRAIISGFESNHRSVTNCGGDCSTPNNIVPCGNAALHVQLVSYGTMDLKYFNPIPKAGF